MVQKLGKKKSVKEGECFIPFEEHFITDRLRENRSKNGIATTPYNLHFKAGYYFVPT
ncbi:MAG: hypothetical protein Q6356_011680 [Candidatus Wukongarchaeota archaeon]|nr:hypothetical protein [Candidatus Wukongarchaeota archaeon]